MNYLVDVQPDFGTTTSFHWRKGPGLKSWLIISPPMNNIGEITAYEFFRRERNGEDRFIGTLPERRKVPERITHASIMNRAKVIIAEDVFHEWKVKYLLKIK